MASFLDQTEPVVVLVGLLLPYDQAESNNSPVEVLVGDNEVVEAPRELAVFLDYVTTPRLRSEVVRWVDGAGGSEDDLDMLISAGRLLQVGPAGSSGGLIDSFAGLRVVPMGFPVDVPDTTDEVVLVSPEEDSTKAVWPISWLLAAAMWEPELAEDLPSAARRIAPRHRDVPSVVPTDTRSHDLTEAQIDRLALFGLDGLLAVRLARLEQVTP